MSGSKIVEVKTGSRITIPVPLEGLSEKFGGIDLDNITTYAIVYDGKDNIVHRPSNPLGLANNQEELIVVIPGEETSEWIVNTTYYMDVLFYEATSQQRELSETYYLEVIRGYARPPLTGLGTGSYDKNAYPNQYNQGS